MSHKGNNHLHRTLNTLPLSLSHLYDQATPNNVCRDACAYLSMKFTGTLTQTDVTNMDYITQMSNFDMYYAVIF
jgi:hypothetical protein